MTMKYFNKIAFLLAFGGSVIMTGCKKEFLDINNDPNRVTEENITPELIFPQTENAVGSRVASRNWSFLNSWMGYTAASGSFAIDQTETTYNIDFSFGDALWQNHYNVLFDLNQTKVKALEDSNMVLAGAAMILSAKLWQELVDVFGNLPYSEAFQSNVTTRPKYDDAKQIYNSLLLSLDTAKEYMSMEAPSSFGEIDLIAGGDQELWLRLANTFKLRLLIRQSEVSGFDPSAEIQKMLDGGSELNVLDAGEDVMVNPGYVNEANKQSPFYANYGQVPAGGEADPITRANNYFVDLLTNNSDPRLSYFFEPVGGNVVGNDYGAAAGNPAGSLTSSYGPGLVKSADQDQWIYPAFESLFLEAEAIARGWVPGDAQAVYEEAVTSSFEFLEVEEADSTAEAYLQNQSIADWSNAGSTPLEQAKFIAYQKYIANAGVDPYESWCDLRRLDMIPDKGYITVNPGRVSNSLPVRLLYPQSEYTTNAENVNAQGNPSALTAKIFWQP